MFDTHSLLNYMNDMAVNILNWNVELIFNQRFISSDDDQMLIKSDYSNNSTFKGIN